MINVVLIGYGKMGQVIEGLLKEASDMKCVGIVDPLNDGMSKNLGELLQDLSNQGKKPDVIIDFSHPANLEMIVKSVDEHPIPLVIATTGFTDSQVKDIKKLGEKAPVVFASNFSIGINLMKRIVKEVRDALGAGFDIEIIEKHHNRKLDSPSGTAITLVDAIDPNKDFARKYGREGMEKRSKEIGIHSVRGGSIAGEHTVIFAAENEIIEITHKAESNKIFAKGAIRAAGFIAGKEPGLYDMNHVLMEEIV